MNIDGKYRQTLDFRALPFVSNLEPRTVNPMHLTDSHAHLDMFPDDMAGVLARAHAAGVRTILAIGIGDGPRQMQRALEIVKQFSGQPATPVIYASAGIHPQEAHQANDESLARLATLADNERVVAIGEIGLDYYHLDNPPIAVQRAVFVAQMQVAAAARKPILIHCRTSELATPEAKKSSPLPMPGKTFWS